MAKRNKEEIMQESVERLLESFKTGNMPEAVAFTIIRRHEDDICPSMKWSFGNQILMMVQGTADARGFKQWQEVGRNVKKGAKAIFILTPLTYKIKEKDDKGEDKEKVIVKGFRPMPVFRYEDTEGEPLPDYDYAPEKLPSFMNVAEKIGVEVEYKGISKAALGSYSPGRKKIILNAKDDIVYFHELAHAMDEYLHGALTKDNSKENYAVNEIVAEFSSSVMCDLQGIKGYEKQAYSYIEKYTQDIKTNEGVLKEIMKVLNRVENIVSKVLEFSKEKEIQ